jgi:type II secretory pathway pseudopilin PulG
MVEMAVSLTVLLILTAMAVPSLMRSFRTYQLNDAAARLSDMLKFTRFEAVRRNTLINCQIKQILNIWTVWTTPNGNTTPLATEKQLLITGFATLLPSTQIGLPDQAPICNKVFGITNNGPCLDTTKSGSNGTVTFDPRGAIRVGGSVSSSVFVLYVGSDSNPEFGYRAVILLPSGITQIWTAPNGGAWQQLS